MNIFHRIFENILWRKKNGKFQKKIVTKYFTAISQWNYERNLQIIKVFVYVPVLYWKDYIRLKYNKNLDIIESTIWWYNLLINREMTNILFLE